MRYFRISADGRNPQPRFLDWYAQIRPGRRDGEVYGQLERLNRFEVELDREVPFMDLIDHPHFLASKGLADLIRLYSPKVGFKYAALVDRGSRRMVNFQIPDLPEVECLDGRSELSRDRGEIMTGVLRGEKVVGRQIFRAGGVEGRHIVASLAFVESAYRREVKGMKIEEYIVE